MRVQPSRGGNPSAPPSVLDGAETCVGRPAGLHLLLRKAHEELRSHDRSRVSYET